MIDIVDMARRRLGEGLMAETEARMAGRLRADIDLAIMRLSDRTSSVIETNLIKKPKSAE